MIYDKLSQTKKKEQEREECTSIPPELNLTTDKG